MKKVISIFFAMILIFSLTACGSKQPKESSSDTARVSADTTINSNTDNSSKQSESTTANESDTKTKNNSNQPAAADSAQKTSEAENKQDAGSKTKTVSSSVTKMEQKHSDTGTGDTKSKSSPTPTKPQKKEAKILIAYFSRTGSTQQVANIIRAKVGGDMFKIESKMPYSDDYNTVLDQAQKEQRSNARPELASYVSNMDNYDIVFIGYPNWWSDTPMPVLTFLERYKFSGKKVIPFCTHGGGGSGKSFSSIKAAASGANVLTGFSIQGSNASNAQSEVEKWLNGLGI